VHGNEQAVKECGAKRAQQADALGATIRIATPYALMLADLERSGLTSDDAKAMRLEALAATETADLVGEHCAFKSYKIPYFDLDGNATDYFRVRFTGDGAFGTKPEGRYRQSKGSAPHACFPPNRPWAILARDADEPVYITEGEKKAYRAAKEDLNVIALGGVWSFKSKKLRVRFLPELEEFAWRGRVVYLAFDSDRATNEHIVEAERALTRELVRRGASVRVIRQTAGPDGAKRGLDDTLETRGGLDELRQLTEAADVAPRHPVERLNASFGYIMDKSGVVELATGRTYTFKNFCLTFADYNADDEKTIATWLTSEARNNYDHMVFRPGEATPDVTVDGKRCYNLWHGWPVDEHQDDEKVAVHRRLLDHIFANQPEALAYFVKLIGYKVRHPSVKIPVVPIIIGGQGSGKTVLGLQLGAMFGEYCGKIVGRELTSPFTGWAIRKAFIVVNELDIQDKRAASAPLKSLFSERELSVNEKYGLQYVVDNVIFFYVSTNSHAPLEVELDDRRVFIVKACQGLEPRHVKLDEHTRQEAWAAVDAPGFAAALLYHYRRVDLRDFDPFKDPPPTAAKEAAKWDSLTSIEKFCLELKENPDRWWHDECDLGEVRDVRELYECMHPRDRVSDTAVGMAMTKLGFPRVPTPSGAVRTKSGMVRLRALRNHDKWQHLGRNDVREWQRHYDEKAKSKLPRQPKFAGGAVERRPTAVSNE
jgi:hypothetical protein